MSDREAEFREFVAAQMESLRGLAFLTCGDWHLAEDAVLTALSRLYGKWSRLDNPGAYARTAVVRAAIDQKRTGWWRREKAHGDALPEVAMPDQIGGVDERLRVRQALSRVPTKQRAVIVLRYLEGLSVQETAQALGCPEGTVKAYTSRGLDVLRGILDERAEGRRGARTA